MSFDPNQAASTDAGLFGVPTDIDNAALIVIPVPWEVTTSYGGGTVNGPEAILTASHQLDLFDLELGHIYEPGIAMLDERIEVRELNEEMRGRAEDIIEAGVAALEDEELKESLERINHACAELNAWVKQTAEEYLRAGKLVGIVGGDHAVPFGAYEAIAESGDFGILHIDAHSDTRLAYEGFTWSHASIMRNALDQIPAVKKLVQVGIRDFCKEEHDYLHAQGDRVSVFFDQNLAWRKGEGTSWLTLAKEIVAALPERVWISVDIDGLDPTYCPHTGTPVPGGLTYHEVVLLLSELGHSGKRIIGFDLVEVAPDPEGRDEWDGNVGMRLLYKLCGWTLKTNGKLTR